MPLWLVILGDLLVAVGLYGALVAELVGYERYRREVRARLVPRVW